jgi:hypothetical protein
MTAADNPEQIAATREAVDLGMQTAQEYWQSAAANPGVGLSVALPSEPDALGRTPQGLGFDLPPDVPALRKPEPRPRLVPEYASEPVGGMLHHSARPGTSSGMDGVAWPPGTNVSAIFPARSSVQYIGASARQTWRSRLREAWAALTGR